MENRKADLDFQWKKKTYIDILVVYTILLLLFYYYTISDVNYNSLISFPLETEVIL